MPLDKKKYNIYLTGTIIIGAFVFMGISTWLISSNVDHSNSREMAIDRMVDECWERKQLQ